MSFIRALLACFILSAMGGVVATAQAPDERRAEVALISERDQAIPGETFYLGLEMVLDEGWHVYWRNPGDAGLAPEIAWNGAPPAQIGDFIWPIPDELPVVANEIMDYGYDDRVVLPFPVTIPGDAAGAARFDGLADYLICKDICIPEIADISLIVEVGAAQTPDPIAGAAIAQAIEATPRPFEGEANVTRAGDLWTLSLRPETSFADISSARFFPFGDEIVHAAGQSVSAGDRGIAIDLSPAVDADGPLDGVVVVENQDGARVGFEVSATPGPVLEGAAGAPLVGHGESAASSTISLLAVIGLAFLGGAVLNLMPCVLPVLSIKAMGMVSAATKADDAHLRAHGVAYAAGVVICFLATAAVFVALRGAGEFVSLGFQLQYPAIVAALALVMFLIGLWLLGVFEIGASVQGVGAGLAARSGSTGAFFTGVLAAVVGAPCVGPFLGAALGAVLVQPAWAVFVVFAVMGLGLAAPFLLISFAPGLHRFLPKPGAWMERLKQFFAFPMFLTAVWLLWVLSDQAGGDAAVAAVLGASLVGFGVWAISASGGAWKAPAVAVGAAALIAGLVLPVRAAIGGEPDIGAAGADAYAAQAWSPETVDALLNEGRGVFVDFTATWCVTCQANKRTTLTRPDVRGALQEADIEFLVADFTNKDEAIGAELKKRGRPGVPMYLLYAPGETEPKILPQILTPGLILREIEAAAG